MARNDQVSRILKVLHYLETSNLGLCVADLLQRLEADGFAISQKTVRRDLDALQLAHIPLTSTERDGVAFWKLETFIKTENKSVAFSYHEVMALYVAKRSLDHLKGSPLYEVIDRVFTRIETLFGTQCEAFTDFIGTMYFRPQMTWQSSISPNLLNTVHSALEEGHLIKFMYEAQSGPFKNQWIERTVGPESLYFADGAIYLVAVDLEKDQPRTYSLARMKDAEMLTDQVYNRKGLDPENHYKHSFGLFNTGEPEDVQILVIGPIGQWVSERKFHESQVCTKTDHGYRVSLHVKINDEFIRWVLSLGPSANVVAPLHVRTKVKEMAESVVDNYLDESEKIAA